MYPLSKVNMLAFSLSPTYTTTSEDSRGRGWVKTQGTYLISTLHLISIRLSRIMLYGRHHMQRAKATYVCDNDWDCIGTYLSASDTKLGMGWEREVILLLLLLL